MTTAAHPEPVTGPRAWTELLRAPGVPRVVVAGLVARLSLGMNPVAIVLLVREHGGSYALAGLLSGGYALAIAANAPVLGRLVDRVGQPRVLVPLAVGFPAGLAALVLLTQAGAATPWLLISAMATGAFLPPIGACMRAIWPMLVPRPELRGTAYALEASLQEIFFLAGPLLVAILATVASPAVALWVSAATAAAGTLAFALSPAARRGQAAPRAQGQRGGALASAGVRTVALASLAMGAAFGALEVSMPAFGEAHGSRAAGAGALASIALGSLVGGLWLGARPATSRPVRRYELALLAFAAGLLPLLLAGSIAVMAVLVFVSGLAIAPAFASAYGLVDDAAIPGTTTEAFAWLSTAILLGITGGTATAGALIERGGTDASWRSPRRPPSPVWAAPWCAAARWPPDPDRRLRSPAASGPADLGIARRAGESPAPGAG
jgi:MFS family permease